MPALPSASSRGQEKTSKSVPRQPTRPARRGGGQFFQPSLLQRHRVRWGATRSPHRPPTSSCCSTRPVWSWRLSGPRLPREVVIKLRGRLYVRWCYTCRGEGPRPPQTGPGKTSEPGRLTVRPEGLDRCAWPHSTCPLPAPKGGRPPRFQRRRRKNSGGSVGGLGERESSPARLA